MNKIFNEDCLSTMSRDTMSGVVDVVLTSPPYNTSRKAGDAWGTRYDVYSDQKTDDEYVDWILEIFKGYDVVLKPNGSVLFNISYSSENTSLMWVLMGDIIRRSNFTIVDDIIWKKKSAIPNNRSSNKLTRIVEHVFVLCRKSEEKTFFCNKKVVSTIEKTGQANYENIFNIVFADNNDGSNDLNKATFSTDLVKQLLKIYAPNGGLVYDSFMGIGTTAKGCISLGLNYVGSEISANQIEHFNSTLSNYTEQTTFFDY